MRWKYLTIVLPLLLSLSTLAQKTRPSFLDSLKSEIRKSRTDTARIRLYHLMAEALSDKEFNEAIKYADLAVSLALKTDDPVLKVRAYTKAGSIYRRHSDYHRAIGYFRKAIAFSHSLQNDDVLANTYLESGIAYLRISRLDSARISLDNGFVIAERYDDMETKAAILNMNGNVSMGENNFSSALDQYIKSAALFEKIGDKPGLTQALSNIGNIQYLMQNYDKAEDYALQSLVIAQEAKKVSSIAYSNRLLGRIYRKQRKWQDALDAYQQAIEIYQSIDAKRDIGETHLAKGNIYFEMEAFDEALKEYFSAIRVERSISDTTDMAYAFAAIGATNFVTGKNQKALLYYDTAKRFAERKGLTALTMSIHEELSEVFASQKDYQRAFESHQVYSKLNDSLATVRNRREAEELEVRYQNEKKENQIRELNATTEIRELQRNFVIGFSILSLALLMVLFNRYKIKAKASKRLEELDLLKSRFFANISHEFRTPLSLILGPIRNRIREEGEASDLLMMERNAKRLLVLINQLLDLSRIESGNMKLELSRVDLRHVIHIIFSSFTTLAEQKEVDYLLSMDETLNSGVVDRDKLEKIIYNLLSNAFKFTPGGGRICLDAQRNKGNLIISVSDTGIGIPGDKLPYIFNRFYQVDSSATRAGEGTGIGLALCKELAELQGGTIDVKSDEHGSEFIVKIPIHDRPVTGSLTGSTKRDESFFVEEQLRPVSNDVVSPAQRPVILIAEDHHDMREFIAENLRDEYRVVQSDNGNTALSKAQEMIPDLIISDMMMPGLDGLMLCEKIKATEATSHIPFIILTAKAGQQSKLDGLQTGADDYLTKPFDALELRVRVKNLIDQRTLLRELFRQQLTLLPNDVRISSAEEVFLTRVTSTLEENYSREGYGLTEFTNDMGMSRMQLHRKLKGVTGYSPGEFIRRFRLERAKQLLCDPGITISEVAYQVGYNNLSNFTRIFKEFTGSTPSEYRTQRSQ